MWSQLFDMWRMWSHGHEPHVYMHVTCSTNKVHIFMLTTLNNSNDSWPKTYWNCASVRPSICSLTLPSIKSAGILNVSQYWSYPNITTLFVYRHWHVTVLTCLLQGLSVNLANWLVSLVDIGKDLSPVKGFLTVDRATYIINAIRFDSGSIS